MTYKIYRVGNYIHFEWQTFKKQHAVDELEFEKNATQFLIKNKLDNKVIYNFNFNQGVKENNLPYTELELTTFLSENTASVTSAGDGSSTTQVNTLIAAALAAQPPHVAAIELTNAFGNISLGFIHTTSTM